MMKYSATNLFISDYIFKKAPTSHIPPDTPCICDGWRYRADFDNKMVSWSVPLLIGTGTPFFTSKIYPSLFWKSFHHLCTMGGPEIYWGFTNCHGEALNFWGFKIWNYFRGKKLMQNPKTVWMTHILEFSLRL